MNTDSLRALWKTVFGDTDAFLDNFFRIAYSPDRCRFIEENGDAICVLYWFDCSYSGGKLAYIYAVATHPQHRGKGLASQLLQQTHEQLKQMGYAGAVLKPAKGLFPFYKRLGYVTSGFIRRFYEKASTVPTDLTELTPEAYGRRRQAFLPPDAIIQDGITLDFLHSYASFYAAGDALVCALPQEGVIFEYLGNPHSAPGILAALGISEAEIPTVGQEIPFSMFRPLNCTKTPGYLGISLE